jgi:hypothetical protein
MKTPSYLVILAMLEITFAGCANQSETASSPNTSATRSYSSSDLQRTGKRDAGDALRSADPAVTTQQ